MAHARAPDAKTTRPTANQGVLRDSECDKDYDKRTNAHPQIGARIPLTSNRNYNPQRERAESNDRAHPLRDHRLWISRTDPKPKKPYCEVAQPGDCYPA